MYLSNDAVHISEKIEKHATLVSLPVTLKFMENDLASMTDQYVFDINCLFIFFYFQNNDFGVKQLMVSFLSL